METTKYKIVVAYDGTNYHGWQIQKDKPTITQALQDTFKKVFGSDISILGASRTDAGVHALGQVASFKTDRAIDPQTMRFAWNNALPNDIKIASLAVALKDFHPFYSVQQKTYHYHVFLDEPSPLVQRYGWYYHYPVDIEKLKQALNVFVGTHDFKSFCAADVETDNTIRTVDLVSVDFIPEWNAYRISITAERFLRYMIRRLVGAALKVARNDTLSIEDLKKALEAKNPNNIFPTAAAQGLTLQEVVYKMEDIYE